MNTIQLKSEVAGFYKLTAHKADADGNPIPGSERLLADWFENLIVDAGLHRIGANVDHMTYCQVGTGSTAPANSDTQLQARIAGTNTQQSSATGAASSSPYYGYSRITYRFATGVAAGNLSEVGVGWASTGSLFSRALILDGGGSPTTITVLSDETLDVTYELRDYANETDNTGTVVLDGITYDYTSRHANANATDPTLLSWAPVDYAQNSGGFYSGTLAYASTIGAITSLPAGVSYDAGFGNDPVSVSYANDFIGSAVLKWGLNYGNVPGGIQSISYRLGWGYYQTEFDPVIPKTAAEQLTLTVSHSWARRP